jgi:hypothetical protein
MKSIIVLSVLFVQFFAYADQCPKLAATYNCGGSEMVIKSIVQDGVTLFKIDGEILYTDKQVKRTDRNLLVEGRNVPIWEDRLSWCENNVLHHEYNAIHAADDQFWKKGTVFDVKVYQYSLDPFGDLKVTGYWDFGFDVIIDLGKNCTRVN